MSASDDLQFDMAASLVGVMIVLFDLYYKDIQFIAEESPLYFSVELWYQEEPTPEDSYILIQKPKIVGDDYLDFDDFSNDVGSHIGSANGINCEVDSSTTLSPDNYVYYAEKETSYSLFLDNEPIADTKVELERISITRKKEFADNLKKSGFPKNAAMGDILKKLSDSNMGSKLFWGNRNAKHAYHYPSSDPALAISESSDHEVTSNFKHFTGDSGTNKDFWHTHEYELSQPDYVKPDVNHFDLSNSVIDILKDSSKEIPPSLLASFLPFRQFAHLTCSSVGKELNDVNKISINIKPKKCIDAGIPTSNCTEPIRILRVFAASIDHSYTDKPITWTIADGKPFPGSINGNKNTGNNSPIEIDKASLINFNFEDLEE